MEKKHILDGIKDSDYKIKKLFEDIMEQKKRTSHVVQTSFEQLKTCSIPHQQNKSFNLSRDTTLLDAKDHGDSLLNNSCVPSLPEKKPLRTTHLNLSQDTNDLLNDDDDDEDNDDDFGNSQIFQHSNVFGDGLGNKTGKSLRDNGDKEYQKNIKDEDIKMQIKNEEFQEDESVFSADDSLICSLMSVRVLDDKDQYQSQRQQQTLGSMLREDQIDFGSLFLYQKREKTLELMNSSDREFQIRLRMKRQQFSLDSAMINVASFTTARIRIECSPQFEGILQDELILESHQNEECFKNQQNIENGTNTQKVSIMVRAFVIKPYLTIKSDMIMHVYEQFTTIEAKYNEFGEFKFCLCNPMSELSLNVELEVVQRNPQMHKITFFPQNCIIKPFQQTKISLTISQKYQQLTHSPQIFCILLKLNSSPIIFPIKFTLL